MAGRSLLVDVALSVAGAADLDKAVTSTDELGKKSTLTKGAVVLAGTAIAGAFGVATKGALEAEAAQGKFMAATGASREEAKDFVTSMDGLAGSAGTVGMKFEDIAELGTTVSQQFKTTGQDTADLTEDIAEFARVTGGDANQAAGDLEDTLSAFGLGADDAAGFMDQLVASSQEFGTDAGPEALQQLRDMSPALQTLGGDLTDGVGFLNLFETAGLDAGAAAKGLKTAVNTLKPGQDLDDLIAQIGAIEDPLERARKASEIFGKAAGQKLAAAITPGMTSLDDFKVSAEDAAGTTEKAANDMLTFGDRIQGFVDKAMAGAREIGQELGPAVTGLSSLVSLAAPFAGGVKDMLSKALAIILPSATATGVAIGEAEAAGSQSAGVLAKFTGSGNVLGKALGLGIAAGVGLVLADQLIQVTQQVKTQIETDPNGINSVDLFDARAPMWAKAKLNAQQQMQTVGTAALEAFNKTWNEGIAQGLSPSDPALLAAATAAGTAAGGNTGEAFLKSLADHARSEHAELGQAASSWADAISSSGSWGDAGTDAARSVMGDFLDSWHDQKPAITNAGEDQVAGLVHGLEWGIPDAHQVWKDYVKGVHTAIDPLSQEAWLEGKLTGDKLAEGLNSKDPIVKQAAIDTRDALQKQLDDLHALGYDDGTDLGTGITAGVDDKKPAFTQATAAYDDSVSRLPWSTWGSNIGTEYAHGIAAGINGVNFSGKIDHLLDLLRGFSPPKAGPLKDIGTWGENVGKAYSEGMTKGIGDLSLALTPPALGMVGTLGAGVGASAPITINITAGIGDPVEIGRQVSEALRAYQRASGTV